MKMTKKQKIISFIVLFTAFLYACKSTNQPTVPDFTDTETEENSDLTSASESETENKNQDSENENLKSESENQTTENENLNSESENRTTKNENLNSESENQTTESENLNSETENLTPATENRNQTSESEKTETNEKPEVIEKSETQTETEIEEDENKISRNLIGFGKKTQKELYKFFMKNNKKASKRKVKRLAKYYIEEAKAEGINSDVAFVQMCHETGFLRFGNLVSEDMNNFCGLGAMDAQHRGAVFETEELGVRAHIQHLQAYATTADVELHKELVDPRYEWVHKTKFITTIFELTGTWATDPNYGKKLDAMLTKLEEM